jgi:hypothetical protein
MPWLRLVASRQAGVLAGLGYNPRHYGAERNEKVIRQRQSSQGTLAETWLVERGQVA